MFVCRLMAVRAGHDPPLQPSPYLKQAGSYRFKRDEPTGYQLYIVALPHVTLESTAGASHNGEQIHLSPWTQRASLSWECPAVSARPTRLPAATGTGLWPHGYHPYRKDAHCPALPARAYSLYLDGKPTQLHEPRGCRRADLRQPARPVITGAQLQRQGDPGPARSRWRWPVDHGR